MTEKEEMIESISKKMLQNIERKIEEGGLEVKDYKAVTGALKELKELSREERPAEKEGFTVRFVGETEAMAK